MAKIDFDKGMEKLKFWANEDISKKLHYIRTNTGSPINCLIGLSSYFRANALLVWFQDRDIQLFQQHAYSSAKITRMTLQSDPDGWHGAFVHFMPLMSNHSELIHWFSQYIECLCRTYQKRIIRNNVGAPEYHAFQAILALQEKWQLLGERAEYILANPPGPKMRKYQLDQQFYLALAKGDITAMEQVLAELVSPKIAKVRNFELAFGLQENLISTFAVIYAKIAWLHGYQVQIDSPWLPMEWLDMKPLDSYQDEFEFVAGYDIFQPFDGEHQVWSPNPLGQALIDITVDSKPGQKLP